MTASLLSNLSDDVDRAEAERVITNVTAVAYGGMDKFHT